MSKSIRDKLVGMEVVLINRNPFDSEDIDSREIKEITHPRMSPQRAYWMFGKHYEDIAGKFVYNWEVTVICHFGDYQETEVLRERCRFSDLDLPALDSIRRTYALGNANHFTHVEIRGKALSKVKRSIDERISDLLHGRVEVRHYEVPL